MSHRIEDLLHETGVVAMVRGIATEDVEPVASALYHGGVRLMEVTLNTEGAFDMIESLAVKYKGSMGIGAGTVMSLADAREAHRRGAEFLVTPHVDVDIIRYGRSQGLPVFAGAMTPTEIVAANKAGATVVKVFPSASLGAQYFREVRGPLRDVPLMAVGGVHLGNAAEFLQSGAMALGVGSALIDKHAIASREFATIRDTARAFIELYKAHRSGEHISGDCIA
jgi:2-dehydro-3-deoxyphosphogluconate aldolase/(4S)-4-hydroxy-2-oxoglutarate aldolase